MTNKTPRRQRKSPGLMAGVQGHWMLARIADTSGDAIGVSPTWGVPRWGSYRFVVDEPEEERV